MSFNINITGLKTINKFIGLSDTPIYYDNGKFFKVIDNRIEYTDIEWSDITGKLSDSEHFEVIIKELADKSNFALKSEVPKIEFITQSDYDALTVKEPNTLYLIGE